MNSLRKAAGLWTAELGLPIQGSTPPPPPPTPALVLTDEKDERVVGDPEKPKSNLASLPSRDNRTQPFGTSPQSQFHIPALGWAPGRSQRHPLTHTLTPLRLGVPSKSGTTRQLAAPLGGRVNSGVDGRSDIIRPRRPPRQPPTQRGMGPGRCRGAGRGRGWAAAVSRARRCRPPAGPEAPRPEVQAPVLGGSRAVSGPAPGAAAAPPPPGAG